MKIAALDLGTNTFQLLIAELFNGELKKLENKVIITRLGAGFDNEKKLLSRDSINRSIDVLVNYSNIIKKYEIKEIRAVATSVVRNAVNSNKFIDEAYKKSGIKIEVISGIQEAKLSSLGVINSIKPKT
ncbi:MAG: hypothetical protein GTO02_17175 [Candidatus Dadabacteria bacterium]|nr:hypothetical protein [Candidatus Dadabacteria bacterium]NIQ16055.1 hypothetical protein [Candidatus Dadabacteria bacterium]